jgi:hypothetical protein
MSMGGARNGTLKLERNKCHNKKVTENIEEQERERIKFTERVILSEREACG